MRQKGQRNQGKQSNQILISNIQYLICHHRGHFMKIHTKITSIAGLAGSGMIVLSSLLSAVVYKGKYGEPFSF